MNHISNESWKSNHIAFAIGLTVIAILYFSSLSSMVKTWGMSDTFQHCFLILPIALWLVWRDKEKLLSLKPVPFYWALPAILIFGFIWLLAVYIDINVVQQFAVIALIPLLVISVYGIEIAKQAWFPLLFLFFMLPVGEELQPVLINFTADFTVAAVQLTGIPIYREGSFFQLPTGNWSVVKACSGVHYLLASVTLGFLYAYITYVKWWKRLLFIAISFIVPVIANGIRAFLIVMIGHFSGMELATGVDHIIFGWIFFGVVVAIMFYLGSFFREDDMREMPAIDANSMSGKRQQLESTKQNQKLLVVLAIYLVLVAIWPLKIYSENSTVPESNKKLAIGEISVPGWQVDPEGLINWKPSYKNLDLEFKQSYSNGSQSVLLYVGHYLSQSQDAELINYKNVML
ncbi:MAG: exosortase A, partial [Gammaproteobacteria bacterium]|nr:exosortase A [Gammaproteobacteria bacterium]